MLYFWDISLDQVMLDFYLFSFMKLFTYQFEMQNKDGASVKKCNYTYQSKRHKKDAATEDVAEETEVLSELSTISGDVSVDSDEFLEEVQKNPKPKLMSNKQQRYVT